MGVAMTALATAATRAAAARLGAAGVGAMAPSTGCMVPVSAAVSIGVLAAFSLNWEAATAARVAAAAAELAAAL